MQSKLDDLAEFGVDLKGAKAWVDGGRSVEDPFYQQITKGAARYTNQIILQPTRMSGLKPRAHTTPGGSLVFQLMGYPTAFSNNILKRGAKRMFRDKDIAAQKLVPTALAMTAVAGATNYMRTRGEGFKDKEPMEVGFDALIRWGGSGILLDQIYRARKNTEYMGTVGIPLGFMGPTVSDVASAIAFRSPIRTLGTKVPFYGLGKPILGEETMTEYRRALGRLDREFADAVTPEEEKRNFRKGGEVSNVPNVPEEPDQRIDKMTGLPYDEQAGEAFIDVEERSLLGESSIMSLASMIAKQVVKATGDMFNDTDVQKAISAQVDDVLTSEALQGKDGQDYLVKMTKAMLNDDPNFKPDVDRDPNLGLYLEVEHKLFSGNPGMRDAYHAAKINNAGMRGETRDFSDATLRPYNAVPAPATYDEMFDALHSGKKEKINEPIADGSEVAIRLDIPAYLEKYMGSNNSFWKQNLSSGNSGFKEC